MAKMGRPRLSAEEHQRRGNFRRDCHATTPGPTRDRTNDRAWLRGLTRDAQWCGRHALAAGVVPGDRAAWRVYLEALARYDQWRLEGNTIPRR